MVDINHKTTLEIHAGKGRRASRGVTKASTKEGEGSGCFCPEVEVRSPTIPPYFLCYNG